MRAQVHQPRPVLDQGAFGKIRDLENYSTRGVSALITSFFLKQAPIWIEIIEEGFLSGHRQKVTMAAHSLKAASGVIGAFRLYDVACQIEPVMENGSLQSAEDLLTNLAMEWAAARQLLRQETFS